MSSEVPHGSTGALGGLDRLTELLDAINLNLVTCHLPFSTAGFGSFGAPPVGGLLKV